MVEYIEREAVIKEMLNRWNEVWHVLVEFPAADVQPVKHGRWIIDNPQYLLSYCSECQCFNSIGYKWKYCPNCGATMDGETDG